MSTTGFFGGVCALALAVPASANEIIGDWNLAAAPSSASLVSGGGTFFDWLNKFDTPIDVDQGFSNFNIIDDGYGNADVATIVEVVFDPGVVNLGDGIADLVFMEARFVSGEGLYGITIEGYEPTLLVGQTDDAFAFGVVPFVDSGEDRAYFYGFNHQQDTADVYGAEIDLSYFGIGVGEILAPLTIRFEVLEGFRAPLGFGAFRVPTPGAWVVLTIGAMFAAPRRRRWQV